MDWRLLTLATFAPLFCVVLWEFGTAFFREHARKHVMAAMAAAREGQLTRAKRFIEIAIRHDEHLRRCDPVHQFYMAIQSPLSMPTLEARIRDLDVALQQRKVTFADKLWATPTFLRFVAWLIVLSFALRACDLASK